MKLGKSLAKEVTDIVNNIDTKSTIADPYELIREMPLAIHTFDLDSTPTI